MPLSPPVLFKDDGFGLIRNQKEGFKRMEFMKDYPTLFIYLVGSN